VTEARQRRCSHHRPGAGDPAHLRRASGQTVGRQDFLKISNGGGERAVDVQMNRCGRKLEPDPSNPVYLQTSRGLATAPGGLGSTGALGVFKRMALIGDIGTRIRQPTKLFQGLGPALTARLPKGLYPRSILIVVMPIILLQSVVAYVFMERHWETVTRRLSEALSRDIAAIVDVIETYPQDERFADIVRIAARGSTSPSRCCRRAHCPSLGRGPSSRFSTPLYPEKSATKSTGRSGSTPLEIPTRSRSDQPRPPQPPHLRPARPRLRFQLAHLPDLDGRRSLVLITIALLFLSNQIKPILRLARAAEQFGKGRPVASFLRAARARSARRRRPSSTCASASSADRAAHHHAVGRQPRPPDHPDPLQSWSSPSSATRRKPRRCAAMSTR
jgi:hypothetical protein